jgi:hypothetical protein
MFGKILRKSLAACLVCVATFCTQPSVKTWTLQDGSRGVTTVVRNSDGTTHGTTDWFRPDGSLARTHRQARDASGKMIAGRVDRNRIWIGRTGRNESTTRHDYRRDPSGAFVSYKSTRSTFGDGSVISTNKSRVGGRTLSANSQRVDRSGVLTHARNFDRSRDGGSEYTSRRVDQRGRQVVKVKRISPRVRNGYGRTVTHGSTEILVDGKLIKTYRGVNDGRRALHRSVQDTRGTRELPLRRFRNPR